MIPPGLFLAVCCLVLTTSKGVVTDAASDAATPGGDTHVQSCVVEMALTPCAI